MFGSANVFKQLNIHISETEDYDTIEEQKITTYYIMKKCPEKYFTKDVFNILLILMARINCPKELEILTQKHKYTDKQIMRCIKQSIDYDNYGSFQFLFLKLEDKQYIIRKKYNFDNKIIEILHNSGLNILLLLVKHNNISGNALEYIIDLLETDKNFKSLVTKNQLNHCLRSYVEKISEGGVIHIYDPKNSYDLEQDRYHKVFNPTDDYENLLKNDLKCFDDYSDDNGESEDDDNNESEDDDNNESEDDDNNKSEDDDNSESEDDESDDDNTGSDDNDDSEKYDKIIKRIKNLVYYGADNFIEIFSICRSDKLFKILENIFQCNYTKNCKYN